MIKISDFVKKGITFEEKIKIISIFENDRHSDGEYVYDLDDMGDAWHWVNLYDLATLYKCHAEGRYWVGGWQFQCNGLNTDRNLISAWCITENNIDNFLKTYVYDEIEDMFIDRSENNNGEDTTQKLYGGLIDFVGYYKAKNPTRYKWVAISNDNAYEDCSETDFDTEEECYNDMRKSALKKALWNTEYSDVTSDDTDGFIGYDFEFHPNMIVHTSYSGTYMYKIVPADTDTNSSSYAKAFLAEVSDYVFRNDYYRTIRYRCPYEDIDKDIEVKGHSTAYNGESEWETGITHSNGQYYVSVFFPNRVNPTHSVDIPITDIESNELRRIIQTFSVKNRREWEDRKKEIVELDDFWKSE